MQRIENRNFLNSTADVGGDSRTPGSKGQLVFAGERGRPRKQDPLTSALRPGLAIWLLRVEGEIWRWKGRRDRREQAGTVVWCPHKPAPGLLSPQAVSLTLKGA